MRSRTLGRITAAIAGLQLTAALAGPCRIEQFPSVAVTMKAGQPLVWARINGKPARFVVDTGSYWTLIAPQMRQQYDLPPGRGPLGQQIYGVNGTVAVQITTAQTFEVLNVPFGAAKFLLGGNAFGSGIAGLIGGAVLHLWDVELDFGHGAMRFVKTEGCRDTPLAYWAKGQGVGVVKLEDMSQWSPYLIGHARVDGKRMRVLFDTGSTRSTLTLQAAKQIGITTATAGVQRRGYTGGVGQKWLKNWVAPIAQFQIGDEQITDTHIRVSPIDMGTLRIGLVLGDDFFLAHHVLIDYKRRRLYFTYNGGPVFDTSQRHLLARGAAKPVPSGPAQSVAGASAAAAQPARSAPTARAQAEDLMHRGMAAAADKQYGDALEDMSRACNLVPKDAHCLLRRGRIERMAGERAKALADLTEAIQLQPRLYRAHLARAALLLDWAEAPAGSAAEARADINIASLLAPDASNVQLEVGNLYARVGQYAAAIRAIRLWIHAHDSDMLLPVAWDSLCRARAAAGVQLHRALRECERAIASVPGSALFLDSRGLVYLRLGEFSRSVASYDAALALRPKSASALFGRGLDELHERKVAAGRSDLATAEKIDPGVANRFSRMHLAP